ncbi:metal ABC transporter solute-binding protein, Zn/Mn family [Paenibacillus sp. SYP-B4298]|uniref:metal ABC transporter solute-binding protein, Zn/Mn family n=1 Tax=Paenibacillus sp. SYP-B4298 TaxID=2996034 RepID=UPI0022DD4D3E|nr:zinc ABC transporter substrate-binding protein [Paenibacillus sp. SYP-B4298]
MKGLKTAPLRRARWTFIYLVILMAVAAACSSGEKKEVATDGRLKVTSTIGMIHDVVANIGGERIEAQGLMGPGTDPHLYKASQGDIRKLDEADIIFYNGLHLEGKMGEVLEKLEKQKTVVAVTSTIPKERLMLVDDAGEGTYDPHVWFDVRHWISAAEVIAATLAEQDFAHAEEYKQRAADYIAQLEELDRYAREQIAFIPAERRILVTAHDAFGYFGLAYGIEVTGLQGISTASEYGSRDVSDLRDYLVKHKIKAVFIESSVPKRSIEAVIEGAKKLGHQVDIGGELFSDAMGQEGTAEGTYIGMFRHNIDTLVQALK